MNSNRIMEATEKGTPRISAIVAVQNQQELLFSLTEDLLQTFSDLGSFEILFVDDGSTDGTWKILQNITGQHKNVRAIKLRTAFGESSALEAAMENARGELIIYLTSRVRVRVQDLTNFIGELKEGADVVVGRRSPRRDSVINHLVSQIFNVLTNRLTRIDLHDINSGVLAARREVLERVPFYGALNTFLPVLAHRQGYRIAEATIEQLPGRFAVSLKPKDYVRRFLDLISVIFLSKYSKKPLHFLGFPGMILAAAGAVIDIYLFFYRLFGFGGIAGRPMLLLGTVLLVIGLQMIAIGLLGEMIIFTHARQIREYNIEEIIN